MGVASNYRFLDYYRYSTQSQYISGIVHYQFRKFLLTQLPMLRFSGVRENIFFNYLKTQNSPHYWEIGYSLDNLFRIFRIEMGAGFENDMYQRGGVRFGIASFINISIADWAKTPWIFPIGYGESRTGQSNQNRTYMLYFDLDSKLYILAPVRFNNLKDFTAFGCLIFTLGFSEAFFVLYALLTQNKSLI